MAVTRVRADTYRLRPSHATSDQGREERPKHEQRRYADADSIGSAKAAGRVYVRVNTEDVQPTLGQTEVPGWTPVERKVPLHLIGHRQMQHPRSHAGTDDEQKPNYETGQASL